MSTNIRMTPGLVKPVTDRALPNSTSLRPAAKPAGSPRSREAGPTGRGRPRAALAGQVVSCRLPTEELQAFDALCAQLGARSRSDGMRSIVRMAAGFLEFSREDSARLEEIRYALGKIGTNVNQIALAANRGRVPMMRAQWTAIEELRRALPSVAKALTRIIAERRRQGVALFRKFAEAEEARRHG
jgi:hypothetical protein